MSQSFAMMLRNHPFRVRWDGLSHGVFHDSGFRLHSNAALASDTLRLYVEESLRYGREAAALVERWDGQRWTVVDGYGDGFVI